jgi:tetratricopeptide (TPR) repeat protein
MARPAHVIPTPAQKIVRGTLDATERAKDVTKETALAKTRKLSPFAFEAETIFFSTHESEIVRNCETLRGGRQKYHTAPIGSAHNRFFHCYHGLARCFTSGAFILWYSGHLTPCSQGFAMAKDDDRLNSWKQIASALNREVRTVQMWEKHEGLPVHRHFHSRRSTVFAFRSEIESWAKRRTELRVAAKPVESAPKFTPPRHGRIAVLLPTIEPAERALSLLLLEAARRLDLATVEIGADQTCDMELLLRWKDFRKNDCAVAELYSVRTGATIWSRSFRLDQPQTGETADMLAQQMDQCLWLHTVLARGRAGAKTRSPDAREAYFKGRYFWNRRSEADLRKALQCFRAAVDADPDFALSYTGIADTLTLLSFYEMDAPTEVMPQARDAAMRAIELEPDLAEAHTSLADVHLHFDWQWEAAGREYRRAIECNPGYALCYHWYANLLAATGQHDAAYAAVMRALEIDPVSISIQVWAGVTSHLARRYDDAVRHYQKALELDPDFVVAHMYLAQALEQKGRYREALLSFDTAIRLSGGSSNLTAMKAHTHALAGEAQAARELLNQLEHLPFSKCMPSYDIAATLTALGESTSAVRWLERARRERNMKLFLVSQDPRFDALRGHSDFSAVVQHLGLAKASQRSTAAAH